MCVYVFRMYRFSFICHLFLSLSPLPLSLPSSRCLSLFLLFSLSLYLVFFSHSPSLKHRRASEFHKYFLIYLNCKACDFTFSLHETRIFIKMTYYVHLRSWRWIFSSSPCRAFRWSPQWNSNFIWRKKSFKRVFYTNQNVLNLKVF